MDLDPLLTAVRTILASDPDGLVRLPMFAGDFLAHVSDEDIAAYAPDEIAGFVRSAARLLAERHPGRPVVQIKDAEAADGRRPTAVTLVEILNDDMPFLLDSILGEINDFGAEVSFVAHPILNVERDADGRLTAYHGSVVPPSDGKSIRESLIQIHIGQIALESDRQALAARLDHLLTEVRSAVEDWQPMIERLRDAIDAHRRALTPVPAAEIDEAIAFLEWLVSDNFVFLGMRDYDFVGGRTKGELRRRETTGLGILKDPSVRVLRRGRDLVTTTPAIRQFLLQPAPLIIAKADVKARVHRRTHMDYVGVKRYAAGGRLAGELRLVGLFTSAAYTRSCRTIPILRRKVDHVLSRAGHQPSSHSGKALVNLLETFPRDELFQIGEDTLVAFTTAILALEERPRIRVLIRGDEFDRFLSIIVYLPRDRYDSDAHARIGAYFEATFGGRVSAYDLAFPEGVLARVHFIVARRGAPIADPDRATLEVAVAKIVTRWADRFDEGLRLAYDAIRSSRLARRYRDAFPVAYRDRFPPEVGIRDVDRFERLRPDRPIAVEFYREAGDAANRMRLKLAHLAEPLALSERVPLLEAMGFRVIDEQSYAIGPADGAARLYLHDMILELGAGALADFDARSPMLTAGFMAVWYGHAESDGYNALIVNARLGWRDIALLRAISAYLRQIGAPYSQDYMWATLNRHPILAARVVAYFHDRFDPSHHDRAAASAEIAAVETALESIESLDEDRIVRRFMNLVGAMLRTNFFQVGNDGALRPEISFKLDPGLVDALPPPAPAREIFVSGPRVEGVHLRFGEIARGGIRLSDRPQDFRTEILGLAKAQQVKNAIIVPVGAKGGFVPKSLPAAGDRGVVLAEGETTYRIFIEVLLDLTDNLDHERAAPPPQTVRYDDDDPYLVVAADKGTATFSDIANEIAVKRAFWLGDAFASGGSAGYDHKAMGITARGAWESVKRHFRELDRDIQTTPFAVVGVGDMSGDVFGNAMLLSPAIRLVAAFDHRDIFIDPDPDPVIGLEERRRLFALPRSSWQDYRREKISAGGGVFSRREKAIKLSPQISRALHLAKDKATPQEVIQAILRADADLLWFGGIGTFIKGAGETNDSVADRANDALRVTASELRVRVVGEGANLGMTQKARIEFGLAGGRCNSDAIDNSAGVNTSDLEVNIKIALEPALRDGRLDLRKRNRLLVSMTDEVAALVLRNNYLQTLAISLTARAGFEDFGFQQHLMQDLEQRGLLVRSLEFLPDDLVTAEREAAGKPLTRAEIGVLLAYAKIALFDDLVRSDVVDDAAFAGELMDYFPKGMRAGGYARDVEAHRLRREIIATRIANAMINDGGPTYPTRVGGLTNAAPPAIARAYVAVRDAFDLVDLHRAVDALDAKVPGSVQLDLYRILRDLTVSKTAWLLRNLSGTEDVSPSAPAYAESIAQIATSPALSESRRAEIVRRTSEFMRQGVPPELAARIARIETLADVGDVHVLANATGRPLLEAASVYFDVGERLGIDKVKARGRTRVANGYFDKLALEQAFATLEIAHQQIAIRILRTGPGELTDAWLARSSLSMARALRDITAAEGDGLPTVSQVTVAANLLADLVPAYPRVRTHNQ